MLHRPDDTLSALNSFGYEYEATSDVVDTKPADLRKTPQGKYPPEIRELYMSYPDSPDLNALTEQILQDAKAYDPYSKAEALRQWVSTNCTYTLEAPPVPHESDAVEYFLKKSKQGYCDLYATALTILCRHAGIPARVATGFAPGSEVPDAKVRTYQLKESDRHAWTEVYFQGHGWVVFDATQDTPGTINAPHSPEPQADERSLYERILAAGLIPIAITALGLCGLLYFIAIEVWMFLRKPGAGGIPRGGGGTPVAREIVRTYQTATKHLARRGIRRLPQTTTSEYLQSVREALGDEAANAFAPLTALMQRAVYSGNSNSLADDAVKSAHESLRRLDTALRQTSKDKSHASG